MHFSLRILQHALVAQWLERNIGNVEVASSTLARGFIRKKSDEKLPLGDFQIP